MLKHALVLLIALSGVACASNSQVEQLTMSDRELARTFFTDEVLPSCSLTILNPAPGICYVGTAQAESPYRSLYNRLLVTINLLESSRLDTEVGPCESHEYYKMAICTPGFLQSCHLDQLLAEQAPNTDVLDVYNELVAIKHTESCDDPGSSLPSFVEFERDLKTVLERMR